MSTLQIVCLTLHAFGMGLGQLFFKAAAERLGAIEAHTFADQASRLLRLPLEPEFLFAIVLYVSLSLFWTWILSFTPLSRAYPFVSLALVFTASIGVFVFGENINRGQILGLILILCGITIIARA